MPTGVLRREHLLLIPLDLPRDPGRLLLANQQKVSWLEKIGINHSPVTSYRRGNATIKIEL
jgi:hypothetical protein